MELSPVALVLLGLLLAAWTFGAVWLVLAAQARARQARAARSTARRLGRMIEDSPAIPLLVKADGKIEGPERLAAWLGLDSLPGFLSELDAGEAGLSAEDLDGLRDAVRKTQKTAAPFGMVVTPRGSGKNLALRGHLADPVIAPGGAALVWWFDFSESQKELAGLRAETARTRRDSPGTTSLTTMSRSARSLKGPSRSMRTAV